MAAAGLPKEEIAVLWGFPIHTNSVPLLVPGTAAVPHVPAANQIAGGRAGPRRSGDRLGLRRRASRTGRWWSWT